MPRKVRLHTSPILHSGHSPFLYAFIHRAGAFSTTITHCASAFLHAVSKWTSAFLYTITQAS